MPSPAGAVVTRAADGGWLLEGGLSAAGSFLAWLGRLLDRSTEELAAWRWRAAPAAAWCRRGAVARRRPRPVVARRRPGRIHRVGRGARRRRHGTGGGGVRAWDVLRVMEVVTVGRLGGSTAEGVTLGGAGSGLPVWVEVLTSVLGMPALRHRSGEAASAGAALLAGKALGMGLTLDQLDPVEAVIEPSPAAVELYRGCGTGWTTWPNPCCRHRGARGTRSPNALIRARRARLRPPRDVGRRARQRRGRRAGGGAGPRRRGGRGRGRPPQPLSGPPLPRLARCAACRRRVPRPDASHAQPHGAPTAVGRAGPLRG